MKFGKGTLEILLLDFETAFFAGEKKKAKSVSRGDKTKPKPRKRKAEQLKSESNGQQIQQHVESLPKPAAPLPTKDPEFKPATIQPSSATPDLFDFMISNPDAISEQVYSVMTPQHLLLRHQASNSEQKHLSIIDIPACKEEGGIIPVSQIVPAEEEEDSALPICAIPEYVDQACAIEPDMAAALEETLSKVEEMEDEVISKVVSPITIEGVTCSDVNKEGVTWSDINKEGGTCSDIDKEGVTCSDIDKEGVTCSDIDKEDQTALRIITPFEGTYLRPRRAAMLAKEKIDSRNRRKISESEKAIKPESGSAAEEVEIKPTITEAVEPEVGVKAEVRKGGGESLKKKQKSETVKTSSTLTINPRSSARLVRSKEKASKPNEVKSTSLVSTTKNKARPAKAKPAKAKPAKPKPTLKIKKKTVTSILTKKTRKETDRKRTKRKKNADIPSTSQDDSKDYHGRGKTEEVVAIVSDISNPLEDVVPFCTSPEPELSEETEDASRQDDPDYFPGFERSSIRMPKSNFEVYRRHKADENIKPTNAQGKRGSEKKLPLAEIRPKDRYERTLPPPPQIRYLNIQQSGAGHKIFLLNNGVLTPIENGVLTPIETNSSQRFILPQQNTQYNIHNLAQVVGSLNSAINKSNLVARNLVPPQAVPVEASGAAHHGEDENQPPGPDC